MNRVCARASRLMQGFVAASVCAPECRMPEITARAQRVTSLSRGESARRTAQPGGAPCGVPVRGATTGRRDGTCGTREGPRRGVVFTVAFRDCRARVTVTECRLKPY